jgi:hypothetical protein
MVHRADGLANGVDGQGAGDGMSPVQRKKFAVSAIS